MTRAQVTRSKQGWLDDPHDVAIFDKSIRGHTDQFVFRFRKPKS
jgi:predicted methyltransferase